MCNVILIVLFSQNFCEPILLLQFRFICTILILFIAFSSTKLFTKPVPSETWQRVQCGFDSFVFPEACWWYTKILFYKFIVSEAWLQSTGIPFSEFNFRIGNWMFYRNFVLKNVFSEGPSGGVIPNHTFSLHLFLRFCVLAFSRFCFSGFGRFGVH